VSDQRVFHQSLDNGLVLICEEMDGVESAAMTMLLPAGAVNDPPQADGAAGLLSEMVFRGAGRRDSRQLTDYLDSLGLQRSESVQTSHTMLTLGTLARNLPAALAAYADVIRRPLLPAEQLPAAQALCLQRIDSLEDNPPEKTMVELRSRHYPYPLGRSTLGTKDAIGAMTPESLRADWQDRYRPNGTIIGIAGKVRWDEIRRQVAELLDDWEPGQPTALPERKSGPATDHLWQETTQTQIGIAYRSVPADHDQYYAARMGVAVLSGGMSGRLFTEVRERRSLCYSVMAAHHVLKDRASVLCYAGTTNERAQETLEVVVGELKRLADGIEPEELERAKAGLKSALIMQGESTSARSGAVAGDWYRLGRVRSLDEIGARIDAVTTDEVLAHLRACPPSPMTVLTLGPQPLEMPC